MSEPLYLLDASALLALIFEEPGGEVVANLIPNARINAVNLSEVVAKLQDRGASDSEIDATLREFRIPVVAFGPPQAIATGQLRNATRSGGLSLGDRACLSLALDVGGTAVTADRAWERLDLAVNLLLIRP